MNELADGDAEFLIDLYQEIINQFVEARDGYILYLKSQDVEMLRKIAHKVHPNLQQLYVDGLTDIFNTVRDTLLNGAKLTTEQITQYQDQIKLGFDYCIAELEAEIRSLS